MGINRVVLATFICLSALHLIFIIADWPNAVRVSKVFLVPMIITWVGLSVSAKSGGGGFTFLATALVFSWFGDVLLLFNGFNFFISGLIAFLLAHVCYLRVIFWPKPTIKFNQLNALFAGLIIFVIGFPLTEIIYSLPGALITPVAIYAAVLIGLFIMTNFRPKAKSFYKDPVILGAFFFAVSDTVLAFNKFVAPVAYASFIIMLNYLIAQYLLASGLIKDLERH